MRRRDTSRACAFSAAVTVLEPWVRPLVLRSRFVCGDSKRFSILSGWLARMYGRWARLGRRRVAVRGVLGRRASVARDVPGNAGAMGHHPGSPARPPHAEAPWDGAALGTVRPSAYSAPLDHGGGGRPRIPGPGPAPGRPG